MPSGNYPNKRLSDISETQEESLVQDQEEQASTATSIATTATDQSGENVERDRSDASTSDQPEMSQREGPALTIPRHIGSFLGLPEQGAQSPEGKRGFLEEDATHGKGDYTDIEEGSSSEEATDSEEFQAFESRLDPTTRQFITTAGEHSRKQRKSKGRRRADKPSGNGEADQQ